MEPSGPTSHMSLWMLVQLVQLVRPLRRSRLFQAIEGVGNMTLHELREAPEDKSGFGRPHSQTLLQQTPESPLL